jgi:putative hydrolase of the HAD superfamily
VTRPELVLFDAGGVLLDLDYAYLKRLIESRHCGHARPIVEEELALQEAIARRDVHRRVANGGRVGEAWRDYFHMILGRVGVPASAQSGIIDALWEAHQRIGLWTVPIDGAVATVDELRRRGYRTGVISNAEGRVERDLERAGFDGRFETVVDSHLVGIEKPDPRIFQIALERLGVAPDRAVYVGDLPSVDVVGSHAAGLAPILLDRHDLYPEAQAPRIGALRDILDLLPDA